MPEMENIQLGINIRLDIAKKRKRTGELETIQIKHREKDTEKINRATVSYGTSSLGLCICNWSLLKDGWQEKYFNK